MSQVTQILVAIEKGDVNAVDKLFPLVYQELRHLAAQKMAQERPGQTLQATALVHEAYLRLIGAEEQNWSSRHHFFRAAAEAMRRILIENARRKKRLKRGGARKLIDIDKAIPMKDDDTSVDDLIALDEALEKLAKEDQIKAELIKLRFFAGLTVVQTAEILEISRATAERYWSYARAWLFSEISDVNNKTSC